MADAADQASVLAQDDINQGVAAARGQVPDPSRPVPECCPDCEERIPDARRELGYDKCVNCAE